MTKVDWLAVHEWATSDNALNDSSLALPDGRVGDTPLAKGAVEPDTADSVLTALTNQLGQDVRVRGDHDAIDRSRNGGQVRVAPHVFDFRARSAAYRGARQATN